MRALSECLPGLSILLDAPPSDRAEQPPAASQPQPSAPASPAPAARQMAAQPARPAAGSDTVLFGNTIRTSQRTPVHELSEGEATAVIQGVLVSVEMKEGWKGRDGRVSYRVQLNVTDHTDSIYCVCTFPEEKRAQRLYERLRGLPGTREQVIVRGVCRVPKYAKEPYLFVNDINAAPAKYREDTAQQKRVELHLHSRMSTMDGLTDVTQAFQLAKRWGHSALAVTDHGVVQAFPEADKAAKKAGVKAIFGVEGYLAPDCDLIDIGETYVVFDIETTGLKPERADIIEIGAVKICRGEIAGASRRSSTTACSFRRTSQSSPASRTT